MWASVSDLRQRRVTNRLNAGIFSTGCLARLVEQGGPGLLLGLLGAGLAALLVFVPFALKVHRGGDAKLVCALGVWLGPIGALWMFVVGVVLGGLLAGWNLVRSTPEERSQVAANLGRAARLDDIGAVDADIEARSNRRHVPMAVAFSLGAVVAFVLETSDVVAQ